jgi:hypothetical protein
MSITIEDRQVGRRLAILRHAEEVTGNVAMTCHQTRQVPTHPGLIDDLDQGHYLQDRGRITRAA